MHYFLGVDAGGTKTKVVLIDQDSGIIAETNGGPANYHNIGLEKVKHNVSAAISDLLHKAGKTGDEITHCTIGIAACDTKRDHDWLKTALKTGLMKAFSDKLTLVNDTVIGLYCGTLPPGIAVICGTGANVYGINSHGEEALAGNWGYFLGDKGSGYILAKHMFEAVVEAFDGIGPKTALTDKLEKRLNITTTADVLDWYIVNKPSIHEVSDFAPLVIEAAEEGDEIARQLIDKSVKELGKAVIAVVRRLKMEEEFNRVVMVGGLFESKYFRAVFEGHITALLKRVRVVKPLVPAAVGAAIMAKHEWEKSRRVGE